MRAKLNIKLRRALTNDVAPELGFVDDEEVQDVVEELHLVGVLVGHVPCFAGKRFVSALASAERRQRPEKTREVGAVFGGRNGVVVAPDGRSAGSIVFSVRFERFRESSWARHDES